jgi:insulysin
MELSAGGSDNVDLFHDFDITIKLTKKGLENLEKVAAIVFQYFRMLQKKGIQEWVYQERK